MSGADVVRIVVVDDHPIVRDGLRGMFAAEPGLAVVAEAADGAEAVTVAQHTDPDVVLMDLRMPGVGGVEAIGRLRAAGVRARVLVLTTYDADTDVLAAIQAGATGYLLKDSPTADVVAAVRAAAHGESVLSPAVATRLVGQVRDPIDAALSERELEVLRLVARGSTNRAAASALFISEATVKTHLLHIYAKLGVKDRASAVAAGYERGLLSRRR